MYRILSMCFLLATLALGITACEQAADTSSNIDDYANLPMAAKPGAPAQADPKIVYLTSDFKIAVMDSTGANQTVVYTPSLSTSLSAVEPNWSPDNTIVWTESPSRGVSQIRAADILVTNGVPVATNVRTIVSKTETTSDNLSIRHARWSSKSGTNMIAFSLFAPAGGRNHVCIMPTSGGPWDTLYTSDPNVQVIGLAFNHDDSKLAIALKQFNANGSFHSNRFIIIEGPQSWAPGNGLYDIPISKEMSHPNDPFDWSRATSSSDDIDRLTFVADGKIYYVSGEGGAPWTQNVAALPGTATWSPNNKNVMFVRNNVKGKTTTVELAKNVASSTTFTTLDNTFPNPFAMLNWHR